VDSFEQIFDAYPTSLQRIFCSLKKIFIEKNYTQSSGYANLILLKKTDSTKRKFSCNRELFKESKFYEEGTGKNEVFTRI